ncbi:type II toxin-antitoxin system RelE/ParE family toxin [Rhizobium sp. TH2]|uniref:type II toxin-antitoxin system RelE/ParE family toxin n=1 Tax=Rhizobium sp. TH2 TaxID=2775403 RepID=UPI0021589E11|nr:type II toxin-antitoxin system RelE/ParE family toxin [Rhizobium sp. TH2]
MRIVRSSAAEEDLVNIWLHVGEHDPRAADTLLDDLDRRPDILSDFPYAGVARDDIAPGIRQLVEGNYLIFYRVTEDHVEIVRVLHARQRITPDTI